MTGPDPTPPESGDDFPEFAEPPRLKPPVTEPERADERPDGNAQAEVDDTIARLKRERDERHR